MFAKNYKICSREDDFLGGLEKCRKMRIWTRKSALIQPRTSLGKSDVSWLCSQGTDYLPLPRDSDRPEKKQQAGAAAQTGESLSMACACPRRAAETASEGSPHAVHVSTIFCRKWTRSTVWQKKEENARAINERICFKEKRANGSNVESLHVDN